MTKTIDTLVEVLINQMTESILEYDNLNPDVGMGMYPFHARRLAIKRLIEQGHLPQDYEELSHQSRKSDE